GDGARRCTQDDVGAERQLGVDARLLVVGGGEEAELDAEGEQEADDQQAPVDRSTSPAGACEEERGPGSGLSSRRPSRKPAERLAAQPDEQKCGAEPEQGWREKHVYRQRE